MKSLITKMKALWEEERFSKIKETQNQEPTQLAQTTEDSHIPHSQRTLEGKAWTLRVYLLQQEPTQAVSQQESTCTRCPSINSKPQVISNIKNL